MPHTEPSPPVTGRPSDREEREEREKWAGAVARLTAPGAPFAVVRGERGTPEYADGPRTLREFVETTWAYGDAVFLVDGERRWSYGEFFAAASALAVRLTERYGLRPGDRAVVGTRSLPEWQIAFWGAQLAGIVAVPLDGREDGDALGAVLDDCAPGVLLVDGEWLERAGEWAARRDGVRVVLFREGRAEGRLPGGAAVERYADFPAPDPWAAPPSVEPRPEDDSVILYGGGARGAVTTHLAQAGAALDARYRTAAAALARGAVPGLGPVPETPVAFPFSHPVALAAVYGAMAAGGSVAAAEAKGGGGVPYELEPTPVTEFRVTGPSGEPVPDDGPGRLWVRGQSAPRGHWRDPEATAEAFDGDWFRTGDLAVRHGGGVTVVGRAGAGA
ncbi:AMP-binding protein [Streptomyces rhizosphaericola]|uniref:AMP-binding protein n=1 Tax=Streptomyces rhizosphaericola TaxID=2564098 RepID=UPI0039EFCCF6